MPNVARKKCIMINPMQNSFRTRQKFPGSEPISEFRCQNRAREEENSPETSQYHKSGVKSVPEQGKNPRKLAEIRIPVSESLQRREKLPGSEPIFQIRCQNRARARENSPEISQYHKSGVRIEPEQGKTPRKLANISNPVSNLCRSKGKLPGNQPIFQIRCQIRAGARENSPETSQYFKSGVKSVPEQGKNPRKLANISNPVSESCQSKGKLPGN